MFLVRQILRNHRVWLKRAQKPDRPVQNSNRRDASQFPSAHSTIPTRAKPRKKPCLYAGTGTASPTHVLTNLFAFQFHPACLLLRLCALLGSVPTIIVASRRAGSAVRVLPGLRRSPADARNCRPWIPHPLRWCPRPTTSRTRPSTSGKGTWLDAFSRPVFLSPILLLFSAFSVMTGGGPPYRLLGCSCSCCYDCCSSILDFLCCSSWSIDRCCSSTALRKFSRNGRPHRRSLILDSRCRGIRMFFRSFFF